MIFYFSGTGNSEFVAKRIAMKTGERLTSIYDAIRNGSPADAENADTLIFVTPTYSWRVPRIVEKWIEAGRFMNGAKAYFVMTCGADIGGAEKYARELCERVGFEFMGCAQVVMPENYVAMFPVPDNEEAKTIVVSALPMIHVISDAIRNGYRLPSKFAGPIAKLKSGIVNEFFYKTCVKADKFRATDACIGCGKCVNDCLLHNIRLVEGRPVWGSDCTHCMRCINDCPSQAIEYGKASKGKPRYHCPRI